MTLLSVVLMIMKIRTHQSLYLLMDNVSGRTCVLLACIILGLSRARALCPTNPIPLGCEVGATCCSGNGDCELVDETISACNCNDGFFPLDTCLVQLNCGSDFECNNNGLCNEASQECDCEAPWLPPVCNVTQCDLDGLDCGDNGLCDVDNSLLCDCDPGFGGLTCLDIVPLPTAAPTLVPTVHPTLAPTSTPTLGPGETHAPTLDPSVSPTLSPSRVPTLVPTSTDAPTEAPFTEDPVCGVHVECGLCYHHSQIGQHEHGCCCSEDVNRVGIQTPEEPCINITEFCGIIVSSSALSSMSSIFPLIRTLAVALVTASVLTMC